MWVLPGIYYICKCSGGGKQTPDYISPSLTSRIIVWDSVLVRSGNYGHCCILPFTGLELLRNFYAKFHVSSQEFLNMASDWMAAHPQPIRSHVAAPKFRKVRSNALQSNTWPLMLIHKNEICFRANRMTTLLYQNQGINYVVWSGSCLPRWRISCTCPISVLTQWGWNKMATISQTTISYAFSWKLWFRLKFHWSLFPRVELTIFHHWFR